MIEINLLPEEKRVKSRPIPAAGEVKAAAPASENLKKLVWLVPVAAAALVIVHGYLGVSLVLSNAEHVSLAKKLQAFQPQMKSLSGFKSRFESAAQDGKIIGELARKSVDWSLKLNRLSLDLPSGIWISDLAATAKQLVLKCSVVSLDGDPVELINRFLSALKDDPDFFSDFSSFDLGSVQKRAIGSYEVADFAVTMEVKAR